MANVVKLKRSSVSGKNPTTSDLSLGEVALNTYDGNLFFKKDQSGTETIVEVLTKDGAQLVTNKTFDDETSFNNAVNVGGDLTVTGNIVLETDATALDLSSGAGILDDQGLDGSPNQILISTGNGVRWITNPSGVLSGLTDVSISSPSSNQVLKYNGTVWVNADEGAAATSAIFSANNSTDLGLVTDESTGDGEDLGYVYDDAVAFYNMGSIAIDGVVGLRNVDQSLKSDYISYSIIFGF